LEAQNEYMYTDLLESVANIMDFNLHGTLVLVPKARTQMSQGVE